MAVKYHVNITDPYIHEPKGAATATAGTFLQADGSGGSSFVEIGTADLPITALADSFMISGVQQGIYDYADTATSTTPISLTLADTQYQLTNDGTNSLSSYGLSGIDDIWDTSTNSFDFSGLDIGDTVDLRIDLDVTTTSTNTAFSLYIELGTGEQLPIVSEINYKAAGTYEIVRLFSVYIGSADTRDNAAKLYLKADSTGATVEVNGWYVRAMHTFNGSIVG